MFYSRCARFAEIVQQPISDFRETLFGVGYGKAVIDLPGYLDHFISILPPGHQSSSAEIIDNETLLPFYAPFLPIERYETIRTAMERGGQQGIHLLLGGIGTQIKLPPQLRFCPLCAEADRQKYGNAYWRRIHQTPGVFICPLHSVWLEETHVSAHGSHSYVPAEQVTPKISPRFVDTDLVSNRDLVWIAESAAWLLERNILPIPPEDLRNRYLAVMISQGFATHSRRVQTRKLLAAFRDRFSDEVLEMLNCAFHISGQTSWVARIVRASPSQNPIRHLLFIRFLGYSLEEFFNLDVTYRPFGFGPWPCLNPICINFQQACISNFQLGFSPNMERKPIGTFSCTSCGYTYFRVGPDRFPEDRLRLGKVVSYGPLWESTLTQMWMDKTVTIRKIVQRLDVDQETVKRHADRLDLPPRNTTSSHNLTNTRTNRVSSNDIEANRAIWLEAMNHYPQPTLAQLIQRMPRVYRTLYRFDVLWLEAHKPPVNRKRKWTPIPVDWEARETQLLQGLDAAIHRLKTPLKRPVRITINSIGKEVGWADGKLQSDLKKMPNAATLIKHLIETHEEFALRRVEWIAKHYMQEGSYPSKSEFIKRAGLSPAIQTPSVMIALENVLRELRSREGKT